MSFGEMKKKKKICNKCRRSEKSHSSPVAAQVQTLEVAIEKFWGFEAIFVIIKGQLILNVFLVSSF